MTSFDDIADKYFPSLSRYHHFYFLFSIIWAVNQPFVLFNTLGFLIPEHYCQQPITTSTSSWSALDIVNLSIPYKEDPQDPPQIGQPFFPCTEYDIDRVWPSITKNTTLDEALNLRSFLYPNLTVRECSRGIQFIPSPYLRLSVAQDFETVCQNRYQISFTNSVYMIGMLVGFLIAGPLGDNLGRRPVVLWSLIIGFGFALLTSASVDIWMYTVLRFFVGLSYNLAFVVGCILMSEWVGKQERNSAQLIRKLEGVLIAEPMLILLFYLIQNWRLTHVAFCYPIIFLVTGFFLWPESPRWLLSQGRIDKCIEVIKTISSRNGRVLTKCELSQLKIELILLSKSMKEGVDDTPNAEVIEMVGDDRTPEPELTTVKSAVVVKCLKNEWSRLALLLRVPALRCKLIIVVIIFFLQAFIFYGVKFYSIRLEGNPFIIALVTGLIALPGNILQWIVYRFFDRKWPMTAFYGITTLLLCVAFILMLLGYHGTPVIVMTTSSILLLGGLFSMLYIRIPEMFPASHRATALGISGGLARLGSALAMNVEQLDERVWAPLPLLIFTLATALAFIVSFLMPPGKGDMLDTVNENNE